MLYLLDTNVIAIYLNQRSLILRDRLESINPEDIAVCSVVKFELFYGAMRSGNPLKILARQQEFLDLFVSLPLDDYRPDYCVGKIGKLSLLKEIAPEVLIPLTVYRE